MLAASVEAKRLGIKTGWRVRDAQNICPGVVVLTPDPQKYRHVHKEMMKIFESYCGNVVPKSIDEAVLTFKEFAGSGSACGNPEPQRGLALPECLTSGRQRP